jgi:hypothetical protein
LCLSRCTRWLAFVGDHESHTFTTCRTTQRAKTTRRPVAYHVPQYLMKQKHRG